MLLHSKLIQAANKKIKPVVIIGQHPEKIKYNNYLFINNEFSFLYCKEIVRICTAAEFRSYKTQPLRSQSFQFSFGQPQIYNLKGYLAPQIKRVHHTVELAYVLLKSLFFSKVSSSSKRILSIGSREVNELSKSKRGKLPLILKVNSEFLLDERSGVSVSKGQPPLEFEVENVNVREFVSEISKLIAGNSLRITRRFSLILRNIKAFKPDVIDLQTASIFNPLSIFAIEASKHTSIKTFC